MVNLLTNLTDLKDRIRKNSNVRTVVEYFLVVLDISFIPISDPQINLLKLSTEPNELLDKPNCGLWVFSL